jgi:hypothetical protein
MTSKCSRRSSFRSFVSAICRQPERGRDDADIASFNERLLVALQRDGSSYLSNATIGGRFALRGCVMNYRTQLRDMEILLDDLRRVAASMRSSP